MIEDFRLKVFMTVVECRSFTKAAAMLGVSQPAVSQHVAELERASRVKLFDRLRGEVILSKEGEVFKKYVIKILDDYHHLGRMFSAFPSTIVRINSPEDIFSLIIDKVLSDFSVVHPEVTFVRVSEYQDFDINVSMDINEKGTVTLNYHPSDEFISTDLWETLSDTLKPIL